MPKSHHHLIDAPHLHLAAAVGPKDFRKLLADVEGFNAKAAIIIANVLSSMWTFWIFCLLALCSLPAVLAAFDTGVLHKALGLESFFPTVIQNASLIALVAWIAQTFVQLTALAVLGYIGNAAQQQNDANVRILLTDGETTREHTEKILDSVDPATETGVTQIVNKARDEILAALKP